MPRAIETIDPVDQFVGERLRAERLRNGLSQAQLGLGLNVTFQQVQKYERGTNRVSASMLMRAAKVLGVSISDFFPADGERAGRASVAPDAVEGGAELLERYAVMDPAGRAALLQVARELTRAPRASPKARARSA